MSDRDDLAKVIAGVRFKAGTRLPQTVLEQADAILAAGYRKPRTITTQAELVALPKGSVALMHGNAFQKDGHYWFEASSYDMPMTALYLMENDFLPATVLYEPTP